MNKQAQRVASLKIAKMEEGAFFKAKKIMTEIMSYLPRSAQALLQGATEDQIATQVKRLKKDKEFMKLVEDAPEKSSIRKLWGYFSFSIKRVYKFGKSVLILAIILGILLALLGDVGYLLMGGDIVYLLVGFVFAPALEFEFDDPKSTRKRQDSNAREIAKNRIHNRG